MTSEKKKKKQLTVPRRLMHWFLSGLKDQNNLFLKFLVYDILVTGFTHTLNGA